MENSEGGRARLHHSRSNVLAQSFSQSFLFAAQIRSLSVPKAVPANSSVAVITVHNDSLAGVTHPGIFANPLVETVGSERNQRSWATL